MGTSWAVRGAVVLTAGLACLGASTPAADVASASPDVPRQQQQQRPVFRAGVELVTVDVVVTDSNDRPITDLTIDDFEIFEEGERQAIADFAFMGTPVMARDVEAVRAAPTPVADVVTNAPPPRESRLFVVVIDDRHLIETDVMPVKKLLGDFFRALTNDDQVAVVYVGNSDIAQDFTSDLGLLLRAVDRITESIGFGHDATPAWEVRDYLNEARSTLFVLRNVTRSLATAGHSRRSLVFVSDGLNIDFGAAPCTPRSFIGGGNPGECNNRENQMAITVGEELEDIYELAEHSGVPIYTVDPRGLATIENALRGWQFASGDRAAEIGRRIRFQQNFLSEIAINTGGRAFINRSNLTDAVTELVAENGAYYLLGYYPEPYDADGKLHEIDVRVKRPGARVRARQGYVAEDPAARPAHGRPSLDAALGNVRPGGEIALRAFAAPLESADAGTRTAVMVEAAYPPAAEPVDDEILLSVLAVDPDGRTRAESHRTITMRVPAAGDQPRLIALGDLVAIPDARVTLRIGVASRALGETATVYLPVDVPDISEGAIGLGGLVLASDGRRAPPSATPPALQALLPFQPTLTRQFTAGETLRVFTRLQWDTDQGEPTVTLTLRGENLVSPRDVAVSARRVLGRETEATIDATAALAGLTPGPYTLELAAALPDGRTVTRRVPFEMR